MIQEKKTLKMHIKDYTIITLASVLFGVAISQFLNPNNIAPGGVSGISMIINRLIPIEVGTLIFDDQYSDFVDGIVEIWTSIFDFYHICNFYMLCDDKYSSIISTHYNGSFSCHYLRICISIHFHWDDI